MKLTITNDDDDDNNRLQKQTLYNYEPDWWFFPFRLMSYKTSALCCTAILALLSDMMMTCMLPSSTKSCVETMSPNV